MGPEGPEADGQQAADGADGNPAISAFCVGRLRIWSFVRSQSITQMLQSGFKSNFRFVRGYLIYGVIYSIQARRASKCIIVPLEMHSLARRACIRATLKRVSEDFHGFLANASGYQYIQLEKPIRSEKAVGSPTKPKRDQYNHLHQNWHPFANL